MASHPYGEGSTQDSERLMVKGTTNVRESARAYKILSVNYAQPEDIFLTFYAN